MRQHAPRLEAKHDAISSFARLAALISQSGSFPPEEVDLDCPRARFSALLLEAPRRAVPSITRGASGSAFVRARVCGREKLNVTQCFV